MQYWYLYLMGIGYIAVNIILVRLIWRFLNAVGGIPAKMPVKIVLTVIYAFWASTIGIWMLFDDPALIYYTKRINNIWLGFIMFLGIYTALAEIVTLVLYLLKKMNKNHPRYRHFLIAKGCCVMVIVMAMTIGGTIYAKHIHVTDYDVNVDKPCAYGKDMTIVLAADMHIGYSVDEELMGQMVDLINEQDADIVMFGGDIVDNDYYAIKNPEVISGQFRSIRSKLGTYAVFGNHDVEEKLIAGFSISGEKELLVQSEISEAMEASNITLLEDDVIQVAEGIDLIGRIDESKPNLKSATRKSIEELVAQTGPDHFVIDLDHEPSGLQEKADAGVDLDLGGHTHNGQIFPGTLTIKLFWDNAYGMKQFGDMTSIVTSGVGVWGPAMRIGAKSEITVIHLHFAE